MIRPVKSSDVRDLVEIYNYYILETTSTLENEPLTVSDFAERIKGICCNFPFIVLEEDGNILGYAYANSFRKRYGYRFTVETSVYVHKDHFRKKIGHQLYAQLIEQIKEKGFHRAVGVLTLPNPESVAFHEKFGFTLAGEFHHAGRKFDQWHNVGFWELKLK
ncbi:MAG: N-acetyltransferase family protein [Flavobacteriales bacterium]|nr:N-acetyltransferase family protein [Flavobacteriales bacterium]